MNREAANRQVLCDIARAAFEVVNRLLDRDQLRARELRSDTTTSRQIIREESITEEVATTLLERFRENVQITLFTQQEEGKNGADWYWRFERGERAIHGFVQAKRVQRARFGQADQDGHIDINIPQLTQLIEATESEPHQLPSLQAWLASYARCDATPPCGQDDLSICERHRHAQACAQHEPSLWIARAVEIRDLQRQQLPVRDVVERSVRLDCILPCIDGPCANGPAAKGFTLAAGIPSYLDCIDRIRRAPSLLKSFEGALRIFI